MSDKTPIFFKLVQAIEDDKCFGLKGESIDFNYEKASIFLKISADPINDTVIVLESKLTKKANKNVSSDFDFLLNEKYMLPEVIDQFKQRMKAEGRSSYDTPKDMLSQGCIDFAKSAYNDLNSFATRTFRAIRWRENIKGNNHFYSDIKFYWSLNGDDWRPFPFGMSAKVRIVNRLSISSDLKEFAFQTVSSGKSEPLAYELLRESKNLSYNRHSRSALLIGIAAIETGVKQCIAYLKPDTQWLIENMPSPNLVQILRDYVSTLPVNFEINVSSPFPKSTILDPLRDLVHMRNTIAHGGNVDISEDKLNLMHRVASDVLRIIDVYMGHTWALHYVSSETLEKMKA